MPDLPNNVLFKEHAMRAVAFVFQHHPVPVTVTFVEAMAPGEASREDFGRIYEPEFQAAAAAIRWLHEEGLLRGHPSSVGLVNAVLTNKAYVILNAADPIAQDRSLGAVIAEWMRDTGSRSAQAGASSAASVAATGALQVVLRNFGLM